MDTLRHVRLQTFSPLPLWVHSVLDLRTSDCAKKVLEPFASSNIHVCCRSGDDETARAYNRDLPFRSIQAAVNAAQVGDTILVRAGVYDSFDITRRINVRGLGCVDFSVPCAIIRGTITVSWESTGILDASLQNLRVHPPPYANGVVLEYGTRVTMRHCIVMKINTRGGFLVVFGENSQLYMEYVFMDVCLRAIFSLHRRHSSLISRA
jgi:hypothetical protein